MQIICLFGIGLASQFRQDTSLQPSGDRPTGESEQCQDGGSGKRRKSKVKKNPHRA